LGHGFTAAVVWFQELAMVHLSSLLKSRGAICLAVVAAMALSGGAMAVGDEPAAPKSAMRTVEIGNTKPIDGKPRELKFKMAGLIKSVEVKEGDAVKAGQVLMTEDDSEELAELDILTKDANNARVEAAQANLEGKTKKLARIEKIHNENGGNDAELDEAKTDAKIAELSIASEKQDLEVKKAKIVKQKGIIERMKLRCPSDMDGIVQSVELHDGEMGDPTKPALRIVNNTSLIIEVTLPTQISLQMKIGQPMRVSYDRKDWKDAKVSFLAPMAIAGAGRQLVHLTLPNPESKVSGLQIFVELPETLVSAN
jgi:multidrug efflux pump subunit AcrA (membrane-fusion protein)